MKTYRGAVIALLLVSVLAGCSQQSGPDTSATPLRTSFPTPLGTVPSLEDLRAAAVSAGMDCGHLIRDPGVYASESGHCTAQDRLQVYRSEDGLKQDVDYLTNSVPGTTLLVGPNWMINSGQAERLHAKLGGAVLASAPTASAPKRVDPAPDTRSYGLWYEVAGLKVKLTTPKLLAKDDICTDRPWETTMTVTNTGKKARDLSYDVDLYGLRKDNDPMVYTLGDQRSVPGDRMAVDHLMIAPGKTKTFRVGLCPMYRAFDASTPLTLTIMGDRERGDFTLSAPS